MIFFTISGFLITSLLLEEKIKYGKINLKFFFIRRFLRLLPPLLIFYVFVLLLMIFNYLPENYLALLVSVFYAYNFISFPHYVGEIAHTWSLGVEEQFYLIWPFFLNKAEKISRGILISLFVLALCIIFKYVFSSNITFTFKEYLTNNYFINRWFIPACLPIMLGSLASFLLYKFNSKVLFILKSSNYYNIFWFLLFAFFYFIQVIFPNLPLIYIDIYQSFSISILLLWIVFNQENLFVALLEFKPLVFLGKISYGIYVYQGVFLKTGPTGTLFFQKYPLNIILVLIISILSYYFVEKKILKHKSKFVMR